MPLEHLTYNLIDLLKIEDLLITQMTNTETLKHYIETNNINEFKNELFKHTSYTMMVFEECITHARKEMLDYILKTNFMRDYNNGYLKLSVERLFDEDNTFGLTKETEKILVDFLFRYKDRDIMLKDTNFKYRNKLLEKIIEYKNIEDILNIKI